MQGNLHVECPLSLKCIFQHIRVFLNKPILAVQPSHNKNKRKYSKQLYYTVIWWLLLGNFTLSVIFLKSIEPNMFCACSVCLALWPLSFSFKDELLCHHFGGVHLSTTTRGQCRSTTTTASTHQRPCTFLYIYCISLQQFLWENPFWLYMLATKSEK